MNAMLSLRKIDPIYLSAVLFAVIAMGVSLMVGFIVGIRWDVVVVRAVIFCLCSRPWATDPRSFSRSTSLSSMR